MPGKGEWVSELGHARGDSRDLLGCRNDDGPLPWDHARVCAMNNERTEKMTEKMTTLYKITRLDLTTYGGFQYTPKAWTPTLTGRGDICGSGWYNAYTHPGLALLLNPIHGNYSMPFRLWRAEGVIGINDHGLKVGITRLRLVQELQMPTITTESRVSFALLAALAVYPTSAAFTQWAESWLSGADRTEAAASEASAAAARAEIGRAHV